MRLNRSLPAYVKRGVSDQSERADRRSSRLTDPTQEGP
jgi:hypothetical protein